MPSQRLLFTRPKGQGLEIIEGLAANGWQCICQPLLDILPITQTNSKAYQGLRSTILNLDHFDVVISVSSNASSLAVDWIDEFWPQPPVGIQWFAVGPSSAAAFDALMISMQTPEKRHSEGLLALKDLQDMQGKKVLILRGVGGRELIAQTLRKRGATVEYAELYQRTPVPLASGYLSALLTDQQIHYALITSAEMAQQLAKQLDASDHFKKLHLIVPSQRIALIASDYGFNHVHVCEQIEAKALLNCLNTLATPQPIQATKGK